MPGTQRIEHLGSVGGPQPSDFCSEADDMCVSFGSLAQQGFPYTICRPASPGE